MSANNIHQFIESFESKIEFVQISNMPTHIAKKMTKVSIFVWLRLFILGIQSI